MTTHDERIAAAKRAMLAAYDGPLGPYRRAASRYRRLVEQRDIAAERANRCPAEADEIADSTALYAAELCDRHGQRACLGCTTGA
jgi:hypothetical protein